MWLAKLLLLIPSKHELRRRGDITEVETFAIESSIRELPRLRRIYGTGHWRKRKGVAQVQLDDGSLVRAEVHWYEAHGVGRVEMKIKHFLDN